MQVDGVTPMIDQCITEQRYTRGAMTRALIYTQVWCVGVDVWVGGWVGVQACASQYIRGAMTRALIYTQVWCGWVCKRVHLCSCVCVCV